MACRYLDQSTAPMLSLRKEVLRRIGKGGRVRSTGRARSARPEPELQWGLQPEDLAQVERPNRDPLLRVL